MLEEKPHRAAFQCFILICGSNFFVCRFDQKADRTETVVARDHRGSRIFHPSVIKTAAAARQSENERGERIPRALTKALRLVPTFGEKDLSFAHIAGMLDRIFVFRDQVVISRDSDDRYLAAFHVSARGCCASIRPRCPRCGTRCLRAR